MVKILVCGLSEFFGGIESVVYNAYTKMSFIYQFDFLIQGEFCYHEDEYRKTGKIYRVCKRTKNPIQNYMETKEFLKMHPNYDYIWIHVSSCSDLTVPMLAKKYTRAKLVVHSHGSGKVEYEGIKGALKTAVGRLLHFLQKYPMNKLADVGIGCSQIALKNTFYSTFSNQHVILNGIDLEKFRYSSFYRKEVRKHYHIPDNALVIGHSGRFAKVKNHKFILEIFNEIIQRNPNTYLLLVGDGPERMNIVKYIHKNKLERQTILVGQTNDVEKFLSAMDVLIFPSIFEAMPMAVIEAQAVGLQCFVSTNVTDEVCQTDLVHKISLQQPESYWAQEILQSNCTTDRENAYTKIIGSACDIDSMVKSLVGIMQ